MNATVMDDLIEKLEPILRSEIRKAFPPQSCIQSCHILSAILEDFGIHSYAFPVQTAVVNKAYADCVLMEGLPPNWQTISRWHCENGAYVIQVGAGDWPGHLVLLTDGPEGAALWDPSIDQANVPDYGLTLPQLVVLSPIDRAALCRRGDRMPARRWHTDPLRAST